MGRKLRLPKHQTMPLEPAVVLALMSGSRSGAPRDDPRHDARAWGIRGRWSLIFAECDHLAGRGPDPLEAAWEAHGDDLTQEAAEHGFRPFHLTAGKWTPKERAAEQRWRDAFLTLHGRRGFGWPNSERTDDHEQSPRNAASADDSLAGLRPWHQDPRVLAARDAVDNSKDKAEAVAAEARGALRALEEAEAGAEHAAAEGRDVDADALSTARRRYEDARALEQIHRGAVRPAAERLAAIEQSAKDELKVRIDAAFQEKLQELDGAMMRVLALHRELYAIAERDRVLLGQGSYRLFMWPPWGGLATQRVSGLACRAAAGGLHAAGGRRRDAAGSCPCSQGRDGRPQQSAARADRGSNRFRRRGPARRQQLPADDTRVRDSDRSPGGPRHPGGAVPMSAQPGPGLLYGSPLTAEQLEAEMARARRREQLVRWGFAASPPWEALNRQYGGARARLGAEAPLGRAPRRVQPTVADLRRQVDALTDTRSRRSRPS